MASSTTSSTGSSHSMYTAFSDSETACMSEAYDLNVMDKIPEEMDSQLLTGPPPTYTTIGASGAVAASGKRKKSNCWNVFSKPAMDENNALIVVCRFCKRKYSGNVNSSGTSSLNAHIDRCKYVPREFKNVSQKKLNFKPSDSSSNALSTWVFDQEVSRDKLTRMLVLDELPFRHVEGEGFLDFVNSLCPMFKVPSRFTAARDVYDLYLREMHVLKSIFKRSCPRICLTTDTWTSVQQINYMVLTAHFIDEQWVLHKKIINFCPITSHKGEDIGKSVEKCLTDWGISNIMCVTVDNASSNDTALLYLKKKFNGILDGKFMHMRCIAHIINLVVRDSLGLLGRSVEKIRVAVRFIKQSPARIARFKECVLLENVDTKSLLCLDVPTRWNSTYLMLKAALKFESVFERYEGEDPFFENEMKSKISTTDKCVLGSLNDNDWCVVKRFMKFLSHFYDLTLRVSGSKYTTSNVVLDDISDTYAVLNDGMLSSEFGFRDMAEKMKLKYDKYWGDPSKLNLLLFIAAVFDPRHKLQYVKYVVDIMFPPVKATEMMDLVESGLHELFGFYSALYIVSGYTSRPQPTTLVGEKPSRGVMVAAFKQHVTSSQGNPKNEMDRYLKDGLENVDNGFSILVWWKHNSVRFPILSRMAKDVLAIPVSTVSSESAFSTGGRVLTDYRSSLTPRMVESLICTQDWIRKNKTPINLDEDLKDIDTIEEDLQALCLEKEKEWEAAAAGPEI